MASEQFWRDADRHLARYGGSFVPRIIKRASGSYVYDEDDNAILDFTSGQMSSILGHSHPDVVATVSTAVATLDHLYSGMLSDPVVELATRLSATLPAAAEQGPAAEHGRGVQRGGHQDGEALHRQVRSRLVRPLLARHDLRRRVGDVQRGAAGLRAADAGQPDAADAERLPVAVPACRRDLRLASELDYGFAIVDAQSSGSLAACLVEPILSSGGIIEPPEGYLRQAQGTLRRRGMLMIVDEAQTGIGRTGIMYAHQRDGIVPDLLTLSKTLGAGLPVAAVITSEEIESVCHERGFLFFTTHVSDPLVAAVALTVLEVVERDGLVGRAERPRSAARATG